MVTFNDIDFVASLLPDLYSSRLFVTGVNVKNSVAEKQK